MSTATTTCATCLATMPVNAGRVLIVDGREVRVCNPCKNRIVQERARRARLERRERKAAGQ